ncbi:TPA: hypothetical protein DEG21_05780 [Patescibacteria group bacterium]|nr:hypothetical protein [Candidatus Gracilibacteria bacterium]HBY75324.1 hypothetical protein [Candidatus Gracilibacteria bacterium]
MELLIVVTIIAIM